MAKAQKIDSNATGLRYSEEESYKVLPASPVWVAQEPNDYAEFGGNVTLVARNPINPSRQRKKGVITDLDASGGYSSDLTQDNMQDLLQGFFFADARRKGDSLIDNVAVVDVDTTGDEYTLSNLAVDSVAVNLAGSGYAVDDIVTLVGGTSSVAATFRVTGETAGAVDSLEIVEDGRYSVAATGTGDATTTGGGGTGLTVDTTVAAVINYVVGQLLNGNNFGDLANDGLKKIIAVTGDTVLGVAENLVTETPGATASLNIVGVAAATADINVDATGSLPKYTSTVLDFTTLGLVEGEWVFVGGDAASNQFVNSVNNGFKRVRSIAATELTIDKSDETLVDETGTGLDIQFFFGRVLKNEIGTLIKRRTYNLERTLGAPDEALPSEVQAEYIIGAVPGEFTMNIPSADKLTADLTFQGADQEFIDGPTPLKSGDRPTLEDADAFNTSSDFSRIKLAKVVPGDEAPEPLFAFAQELSVSINNNLTPNKAVGTLGSFDITAGTFQVSGNITAYFADVAASQAVRNNEDITLDFILVKANAGIAVDLPLLALGDGRANVEQDQAITLPLSMDAATGAKIDPNLDYTAMMVFFDYLPDAADV